MFTGLCQQNEGFVDDEGNRRPGSREELCGRADSPKSRSSPCSTNSRRGAKIAELRRRHGVTETTFIAGGKSSGGLQISEARRLESLEDENRQLKRIVADQALNLGVVMDLLGNKW